MPREAISLFRESGGRLPVRALGASRAVSLGLHALLAVVLIAPNFGAAVAVEARAAEPQPRVLHVFVPPPPRDDEGHSSAELGKQAAAPVMAPPVAHNVDLDGVQLIVVGSADDILAALRSWKGTIGIAQASDPRVVARVVDEHGSVKSTEPLSLDLFWPMRVIDVAVRQRYGVAETEELYLLFPEVVLDGIMDALRTAAQVASVAGSTRIVRASYGFDSARNFAPSVDPQSLVWDRESQ